MFLYKTSISPNRKRYPAVTRTDYRSGISRKCLPLLFFIKKNKKTSSTDVFLMGLYLYDWGVWAVDSGWLPVPSHCVYYTLSLLRFFKRIVSHL